jgi:hypothetical protein
MIDAKGSDQKPDEGFQAVGSVSTCLSMLRRGKERSMNEDDGSEVEKTVVSQTNSQDSLLRRDMRRGGDQR